MTSPRSGILAALWIPIDENGRLDRSALHQHLAWLQLSGVSGILALGSTGEFTRFTVDEREELLAAIAEMAAPMPVIANISDVNHRNVARLGAFARRLGLPGVAVMPPYFYPVSEADQLAFFLHAAEASALPTYLYNFPELAGNRIAPETVAAFAARAEMAGIKQSGGEFDYHRDLIALGREHDFVVFSGSDTRLPEVFQLGATGCIGGLVNLVPELMVFLHRVCREGAAGSISPVFEQLKEVGTIMDQLTFPLNVAAGMEARGLRPGVPKAVVSLKSAVLYREVVHELRRKFAEWELSPAGPLI